MATRLPVFGLGADVIVGFPGETDADFEATVALCRDLPFTYLHVFSYSPRPGTAAQRLAGELASSVAAERSAILRGMAADKARVYAASRAGGGADAIVITSGSRCEAMTEDFLTLAITGGRRARGDRFAATVLPGGEGLRDRNAR
jgi:threonylcarbamoyladenosine tRNA methylthiotransferase MtaB